MFLPHLISHIPTSSAKAVKPKKQAAPVPPTAFDDDVLNGQDFQRITVEHVNKNKASALSVGSMQLRSFSGRVPKPPGEVDFETWCQFVELMFQDGLSTIMRRRMILESLLSPASDIVRQLGSNSSTPDYVRLLQSAYGNLRQVSQCSSGCR